MAAHGVYALTATTGLTAQNTLGVQDLFVVPSEFVRKQINAGLEDVGADVVKLGTETRISLDIYDFGLTFSGMLSSAETINVIAETLQAHKVPAIVLDPVSMEGPQLSDSWNANQLIGYGFNEWISASSGKGG